MNTKNGIRLWTLRVVICPVKRGSVIISMWENQCDSRQNHKFVHSKLNSALAYLICNQVKWHSLFRLYVPTIRQSTAFVIGSIYIYSHKQARARVLKTSCIHHRVWDHIHSELSISQSMCTWISFFKSALISMNFIYFQNDPMLWSWVNFVFSLSLSLLTGEWRKCWKYAYASNHWFTSNHTRIHCGDSEAKIELNSFLENARKHIQSHALITAKKSGIKIDWIHINAFVPKRNENIK